MPRLIVLLIGVAWLIVGPALAQDQDSQSADELSRQPSAETAVPPEVAEFLRDRQPLSELSDRELGERAKRARQLSRIENLSPQMRQALRAAFEDLRSEREARISGRSESSPEPQLGSAEPPPPENAMPAPAIAGQTSPGTREEVTAFLSSQEPIDRLSLEELGQQTRKVRELLAIKDLDPQARRQLRDIALQLQSEKASRRNRNSQAAEESPGRQAQPEAPMPDSASGNMREVQTEKPVQGRGDTVPPAPPEIESKARAIIADDASAERLSDEQLSERLRDMRSVLEEPGLSKREQRALRKKLKAEREVLRSRMARAEPEAEAPRAAKPVMAPIPGRPRNETRMDTAWPTREVLRDRRPSNSLQTGQLRRRMSVYRDAMAGNAYPQEERDFWRSSYENDRRELRRRMFDERRQRKAYWDEQRRGGKLDIDINTRIGSDGPEEVWADEVDDEEIEDQLLAAPRRQVQRRYSMDDLEEEPDLREIMPGVEVDTIKFGFNEAFVREEEIDNLDRIAEAIEKILAGRPGEVFLIEGHTDAVGSDAYNLALSRQRAQAVKEALTTYYVIPPENLETIGYGERYLKIPTEEPEQENRRVGLRRVTPLVGERDD